MRIDQNLLITINQTLDFVPFLSCATALINLITKVALDIFIYATGVSKDEFLMNRVYLSYIDEKSYNIIVNLMIPIFNIFIAGGQRELSQLHAEFKLEEEKSIQTFQPLAQKLKVLIVQLKDEAIDEWKIEHMTSLEESLRDMSMHSCHITRVRELKLVGIRINKFREFIITKSVFSSIGLVKIELKILSDPRIQEDEISKRIISNRLDIYRQQVLSNLDVLEKHLKDIEAAYPKEIAGRVF
jgi:hypothetical protein